MSKIYLYIANHNVSTEFDPNLTYEQHTEIALCERDFESLFKLENKYRKENEIEAANYIYKMTGPLPLMRQTRNSPRHEIPLRELSVCCRCHKIFYAVGKGICDPCFKKESLNFSDPSLPDFCGLSPLTRGCNVRGGRVRKNSNTDSDSD